MRMTPSGVTPRYLLLLTMMAIMAVTPVFGTGVRCHSGIGGRWSNLRAWVCAGGPMIQDATVKANANVLDCDKDMEACYFDLNSYGSKAEVGASLRCMTKEDLSFLPKGSPQCPQCTFQTNKMVCSYPSLQPEKLPGAYLKAFYETLRRDAFEDMQPCGDDDDQKNECYDGSGEWRDVVEWECQEGLFQPNGTLQSCDSDSVPSVWVKGLCSLIVEPGSPSKMYEDLKAVTGCMSRVDVEKYKVPTNLTTPGCVVAENTVGQPLLYCSYKPRSSGTLKVSKEDLAAFKAAMYKAKGIRSGRDNGKDACTPGDSSLGVLTSSSSSLLVVALLFALVSSMSPSSSHVLLLATLLGVWIPLPVVSGNEPPLVTCSLAFGTWSNLHEWACQGGPMTAPGGGKEVSEHCKHGYCVFEVYAGDKMSRVTHRCGEIASDAKAKTAIPICEHAEDTLTCSYLPQTHPSKPTVVVPEADLKTFYEAAGGGKYEDRCVINRQKSPSLCYKAKGTGWKNLHWWECRGGLLQPSHKYRPKVVESFEPTDTGLCYFEISKTTSNPVSYTSAVDEEDEELWVELGAVTKEEYRNLSSSTTPTCKLDSENVVLRCSYRPEWNPMRLGAVSRKDLEAFKKALYKDKRPVKYECSKDYKGRGVLTSCPSSTLVTTLTLAVLLLLAFA